MPDYREEIITGRKNPLILRISKLSDKKYRDAEGLFRFDGVKLFLESVSSRLDIKYVFIASSKAEKLIKELRDELSQVNGSIITVSDEVLGKLTDESAPQGIVTVAQKLRLSNPDIPAQGSFRAIWLSSVRDPGNLGTVIRTAYAFGIDRVFISSDCADIHSPKVIRAAMGTVFRQSISEIQNETEFIGRLRESECEIFAAALGRESYRLGDFDMPNRVCFAVGNEGHGLSDEFIESCKKSVFIPMQTGCESLNAASAASVLIWEMCRDRLTGKQ